MGPRGGKAAQWRKRQEKGLENYNWSFSTSHTPPALHPEAAPEPQTLPGEAPSPLLSRPPLPAMGSQGHHDADCASA